MSVGIGEIALFFVSCVFSHNFIFSRYMGCCPFLGVSGKINTAAGMGISVTFVMTIASLFTWLVYHFVLVPLNITYLRTIAFIIVIASIVQLVEMLLKKTIPSLYESLGIYLPLITTNCAVLGVSVLNITAEYNLLYSVLSGLFGGLGFLMAIVLMAGVRVRLETSKIPECMKGFPISLVTAGLMAVAFLGFSGMVK